MSFDQKLVSDKSKNIKKLFFGHIYYRNEFFLDWGRVKEIVCWLDFSLRIVGFNDCRDDSNVVALQASAVAVRNHHNIDILKHKPKSVKPYTIMWRH